MNPTVWREDEICRLLSPPLVFSLPSSGAPSLPSTLFSCPQSSLYFFQAPPSLPFTLFRCPQSSFYSLQASPIFPLLSSGAPQSSLYSLQAPPHSLHSTLFRRSPVFPLLSSGAPHSLHSTPFRRPLPPQSSLYSLLATPSLPSTLFRCPRLRLHFSLHMFDLKEEPI